MSLIASLLPASHVLVDLPAADRKAVFERVAALLEGDTGVKRALILDSLLARERMARPASGRALPFRTGEYAVCARRPALSCARANRSRSRRRTSAR
jgi:hypothetical protein